MAGVRLVTFEAVDLAWIGAQPLEALFAVVGSYVLISVLPRPVDD